MTTVSMDHAVAAVRATDSIGLPLGPGVPGAFLHALGTRDDFVALDVFGALMPDLFQLLTRPGVRYRSGFYGPAERFLSMAGADVDYVPADFRGFAPILRELSPRIMAIAGAPPRDGWVSLSLHAGASVDELHLAGADPDRLLVVEVSPHFPHTHGIDDAERHLHRVHVDEIDLLVESDARPVALPDPPPTPAEAAIAGHVTGLIGDGCTLQTGIGAIPSQVAALLADGPHGDFGVHSEMFTTGLMRLHLAGKVTNRRGSPYDGFSVTTFALGSAELYQWLDDNRDVRFLPVDVVNSPEAISANRRMVTVNGALALDLSGQVVADSIGGRQFSGQGGHEDFVGAPGLVPGGRSIVCLPATTMTGDAFTSRIVAQLPAGSVVTTPRHHVDIVVTEFGVAELHGRTVSERAAALAAVAHPAFRDELLDGARRWPSD